MLKEQGDQLGAFLTNDPRGKHFVEFLDQYATADTQRKADLDDDINRLLRLVEHIRHVIAMQQKHTQCNGIREACSAHELMNDALLMATSSDAKTMVAPIVKEFDEDSQLKTDRHKTILILVNLIRNARQAVKQGGVRPGNIILGISRTPEWMEFRVSDSGIGFSQDTAKRLFEFRFTTKDEGHGFGLHSSANAARELGGSLSAHSEGEGLGATFLLQLPHAAPDDMDNVVRAEDGKPPSSEVAQMTPLTTA